MIDKMLPLLSDGLRRIIENINEKHPGCDIAFQLLKADDLIIGYNSLRLRLYDNEEETTIMTVAREAIDQIINQEARMLSFRYNAFEISYLPKGKEAIYTDAGTWGRENRQTAKPARIIQKLLIREYKCKEFEDFSNWIKSEMVNAGDFQLVEKNDIAKYYHEGSYYKIAGTLGNSCMRHDECQRYFDVYSDHAKMLVCLKDGKVLGRAIVWELPQGIFMDRVYTCFDYLENQFVEYAESKQWYRRITNCLLSDGDVQEWLGPYDNYKQPKRFYITINLNTKYQFMPYMDSFRYYDPYNNTISTDSDRGGIYLSNTDGDYYEEGTSYYCSHCGSTTMSYDNEYPDNWVYSDWEDGWLCPNCTVYCNGIDDYVSPRTPTGYAYDHNGDYMQYPLDFLRNCDEFVQVETKYGMEYCNLSHKSIIYDEKADKYILKEDE